MEAAGVPCAPGYHGDDQGARASPEEAARIGYPVMVKASAGGGGRGMRIVREPEALEAALAAARSEAENAFGDGRLLIERALLAARHVEVQVFGDEQGAIVHLGERDCSIQRRHQKVIEEAPSPAVSPELRAAMGAAAVKAAAAVGYVGAGTVEFLLDDDGRFYFLEMNTRIQVEHPVTECVTGVDLVRLQFQVAQGRAAAVRAEPTWRFAGHAIEARLYAEDPAADFLPSIGTLAAWRPGERRGRAGRRGRRGRLGGDAVLRFDARQDHRLRGDPRGGAAQARARARGAHSSRASPPIATSCSTRSTGPSSSRDARRPPSSAKRPMRRPRRADRAIALAALIVVERGAPPAPTAGWRAAPLRLHVDGAERRVSVRRQGAETIVAVDGEAIAFERVELGDGEARYCDRRRRVPRGVRARRRRSLARRRGPTAGASPTAPMRRRGSRTRTRTARCARRSAASSSLSKRSAGDAVRRGQAPRHHRSDEDALRDSRADRRRDRRGACGRRPSGRGARASVRDRAGRSLLSADLDKAVVTCALTGVLTDPAVYPAPVTPEEMAREARRAADEGASVVHVHFRNLDPGKGHLPSWRPEVATAVIDAIRAACPDIIVNQTTGVVGPDMSGPLACLRAVRPEIAALNAGSLNYLKTRADGTWAWPPMLFDNPVEKVAAFLAVMRECAIEPEFECFDTGIVRTAAAIARNNGFPRAPKYNFVMGVESGMPADPDLLPILTAAKSSRARAGA